MLHTSGVVHESAYYRVEVLAIPRVVKVTRMPRPFESPEAVQTASAPVEAALDAAGRRSHRLLIDTRDAIGNNDPEYERSFRTHRQRLMRGFVRVALLAKTPVGKLHVERLLAAEKLEVTPRVFLDEGLAMRFLAEE